MPAQEAIASTTPELMVDAARIGVGVLATFLAGTGAVGRRILCETGADGKDLLGALLPLSCIGASEGEVCRTVGSNSTGSLWNLQAAGAGGSDSRRGARTCGSVTADGFSTTPYSLSTDGGSGFGGAVWIVTDEGSCLAATEGD
mmetsp:Transcript_572/g.962  ORF Transcript_572/g.962 Transcript_572/m.962 type:complete len:144 (+) Transcript_572:373-804(+)